MNDDDDNVYDDITLDNSVEDQQFSQSIEDADRYRADVQEVNAQARAFDRVVDGLDALADGTQETYEETRADPYESTNDYGGPQHEQVADGLFVGVAAGVLMADRASQAWNDWGNDQDDTFDQDIDDQLEDENAVLEEVLENDMSQWADANEAMDIGDTQIDDNASTMDWSDDSFDDGGFDDSSVDEPLADDSGFDDSSFDGGDTGDDY